MLDWGFKSLSLSIAELDDGQPVLSSQRVSSWFLVSFKKKPRVSLYDDVGWEIMFVRAELV